MHIGFKNIDNIFARKVLHDKVCDERCYIALSYLFATTRKGHHCLKVEKQGVSPDPTHILETEEIDPYFSLDIIEGLRCLPQEVIQEGRESLNLKPLVTEGDCYYLQKYYFLETQIASDIQRLLAAPMHHTFSEEEIREALEPYHLSLNQEQQAAVAQSLTYALFALTGGPGTGKTYTLRYALQVYCHLCAGEGKQLRILVAAPTGKATRLLKEKLLHEQCFGNCHLTISTLHSALNIRRREDLRTRPVLFYDFIIIDECSMVELSVWKLLLSAIEAGTRVLLMGDPDQLPPVEAGMVFEQLVQVLPRVHLQTSMRVEQRALLELAEAIKISEERRCQELLFTQTGVHYSEYEREIDLFSLPIHPFLQRFLDQDPAKRTLCFLSPILQGPWGVETLNRCIHEFFVLQQQKIAHIPIIVTQTDYSQELYNGDTGFLVRHSLAQNMEDYVLFPPHRRMKEALLPKYAYAYALSVHKSQGSEYDDVILFLPEGAQHFGKEILYTAVTRAKKSITIFSKKGVFQKCLRTDSKKTGSLSRYILSRGQAS